MEPDANSDRVGTRPPFGTDDEYEVQAPAQTTDRICVHVSDGGMSKQNELKWTEHDMKTQYQVRASTQNSEGCAEKDGCDEDTFEAMSMPGQFQSKPPTRTTDRQCKDIIKCAANEYQCVAPTGNQDRSGCEATPVCDEGWYEVSVATETSDRVCARWTVCSGDQYQTRAPSNTVDRQCDFLSVPCEVSKNTYETRTPTSTSDRVGAPLTVCTGPTYELKAPTDFSDRVCQTVSNCINNV